MKSSSLSFSSPITLGKRVLACRCWGLSWGAWSHQGQCPASECPRPGCWQAARRILCLSPLVLGGQGHNGPWMCLELALSMQEPVEQPPLGLGEDNTCGAYPGQESCSFCTSQQEKRIIFGECPVLMTLKTENRSRDAALNFFSQSWTIYYSANKNVKQSIQETVSQVVNKQWDSLFSMYMRVCNALFSNK